MKLNAKLGLLVVVSSILGLIVFIVSSLVIGDVFSKGYSPQELNALGRQIVAEAEQVQSNPELIIDLLERTVSEHPQLALEWVANDGTLIYATNERADSYTFSHLIPLFLHTPDRFWEPGLDITLVFTWEQEQNPQYLIMQIPDEAMQGSQAQINVREYSDLILLILPFLLFLATPYLVSFLFVLHMNRRLKQLTIAMNDVNAEKSVVTIKDQTKDEIGQLTRHFNTMSERISKQVAQIQEYESNKKTMIANLSHDLRTPLTKIQGYAETLQEELDSIALGDTVKESKSFAYIIRKQALYMDKLLQRLLEISDLDTRRGNVELTESNICAQLRKIAADYVPVLENKGMEFNIQIPDQPIYALTDPYLFERAIRNVIENAIQYGSSGHYLGVALDKVEDAVRIRIVDRGPGIPKEQIPFIFERFYRGSAAREGEGMGIGLSIVQEIAAAHHGTVDVHSVTNEKTVFSLTIPQSPGRPRASSAYARSPVHTD